MKPVLLIAILAIAAAGLTALLARSWLDQSAQPSHPEETASAEVLVVARDVPQGTPLKSDDLRYDRWPATTLSPRLISRTGTEDGRQAFVGQIARRQLITGEPLTDESIAKRDNIGLMASLLTAGMRAVSVPISSPSAVSGFITPGDVVDVMLAADLAHTLDGTRQAASENHAAPPSQRLARYAAETVLRNVHVLAIDQQIARAADGGALQGKTATLSVTPKQAEALAVAALLGPLQLVLRGQAEDPKTIAKGFSGDIETSQALRSLTGAPSADHVVINRAGTVSIEDFSR